MNETLQKFARQTILDGLSQCTELQRLTFKRMYSHNDLTKNIEDIVQAMPESKLDWAMQQVEKTLQKKNKPSSEAAERQKLKQHGIEYED